MKQHLNKSERVRQRTTYVTKRPKQKWVGINEARRNGN